MSQPVITLHTPSGMAVELRAHRVGTMNYSAALNINNTTAVYVYAYEECELDEKILIMDHTHIPLLDESVKRVSAFLKETASYINGGPA